MTRLSLPNPGNKFGAQRTLYNGRTYHSKAEAEYARALDLRVMAHDIVSWEPQVAIRLEVPGHLICKYVMDFVVLHNDGRTELVEIKGFETAAYRIKKKLLEVLYLPEHPECFYTVVKT